MYLWPLDREMKVPYKSMAMVDKVKVKSFHRSSKRISSVMTDLALTDSDTKIERITFEGRVLVMV